jgi:CO dehydrogenase/acetyl-CoA synthase beta subunit
MIKANPEWSAAQLKATVQEEMFANCHISKIKTTKSIVAGRMLDAKHGEYSQIFDYQLEMIRSNPGTTCVVKLHPDFEKPTFHKFYICFDALKKGFLLVAEK